MLSGWSAASWEGLSRHQPGRGEATARCTAGDARRQLILQELPCAGNAQPG